MLKLRITISGGPGAVGGANKANGGGEGGAGKRVELDAVLDAAERAVSQLAGVGSEMLVVSSIVISAPLPAWSSWSDPGPNERERRPLPRLLQYPRRLRCSEH